VCDTTTFTAQVTFIAPRPTGVYPVTAFMPAEDDSNPDIPDRPDRLLVKRITVSTTIIGGPSSNSSDTVVTAVGSRGDRWQDMVFSTGVLRTFFGLLAFLVAMLLVVLWRRRAEEDRIFGTPVGRGVPSSDSQHPRLA
jgi:hypothetical protein